MLICKYVYIYCIYTCALCLYVLAIVKLLGAAYVYIYIYCISFARCCIRGHGALTAPFAHILQAIVPQYSFGTVVKVHRGRSYLIYVTYIFVIYIYCISFARCCIRGHGALTAPFAHILQAIVPQYSFGTVVKVHRGRSYLILARCYSGHRA